MLSKNLLRFTVPRAGSRRLTTLLAPRLLDAPA
jgi:hypothetical protein